MLAQKAIGLLVWHGHDRESFRVFLLNRAQQIIWGCIPDIMSERFVPDGILASGCCSPD